MAVVDNITKHEGTQPGEEKVRVQLTGSSSTYNSNFGTIDGLILTAEGTNGATYTFSGRVITITGTDDDFVNIHIWGH